MKNLFYRYPYQIFLFFIVLVLFILNYQSGTYLSGWDNVQTDLNPWLGVKRALFSVWEEYQSFGLVSGLAHAADLPRAFFVFLLSLVLPQSLIRYVFHGMMLIVGTLGMFRLLQHLHFKEKKSFFAFLGALFYLLNLSTIQMFYVPYEPFSVFFAFLPWQIWIFLIFINSHPGGAHSVTPGVSWLFVINLLASPQGYVQTIFLVYLLILFVIFIAQFIESKRTDRSRPVPTKVAPKNFIIAITIIILINSFWLLPQLYFLKTSGYIVKEAKTNALATEDVIYQNKEKGTLPYFLKMEGYYFDLFDTKQGSLFAPWKKHFSKPLIKYLPYFFAIIMFIGLFSRRRQHLSFVFLYIFILLALLNATPPFSYLNDFIRQNNVINQIFRSSFTKFAIPYALVASYFFASGIYTITEFLKKRHHNLPIVLGGTICLLLFFYSFPAFKGNFFSTSMKIKIPSEYLEAISFFQKENKNKRIALLPDYTFWGWFINRWGYDGSGFLWYGIEQPIVSRTFDVWSDKSESYFWEMKYATEAEDREKFEKLLEKYDIDYLILDYSLLPVSSTLKGMQYDRLNSILSKSKKISTIKKGRYISLYKVKKEKKAQDFITVTETLPNIGPPIKLTNHDSAYFENGDYKTVPQKYDKYYPFLDLTTQTKLDHKLWKIYEEKNQFVLNTPLPSALKPFFISSISQTNEALLFKKEEVKQFTNITNVTIKNNNLFVSFKKEPVITIPLNDTTISNCGYREGKMTVNQQTQLFITTSGGTIGCFGYDVPFLEQRYGYLVKIKNKNDEGRRLFMYILDKTKRQSYIEDRLTNNTEYYLVSPKYQYGLGYNFSFHNTSHENVTSKNQVQSIDTYLLPYDSLKSLVFTNPKATSTPKKTNINFQAQKQNYFTYKVSENSLKNKTVILSQSFHPGWKAYVVRSSGFIVHSFPYFFGDELEDHIIINNWANGWEINTSSPITIIFWPQYLEFIGFIIVAGTLMGILLCRRDRSRPVRT